MSVEVIQAIGQYIVLPICGAACFGMFVYFVLRGK